MFSVSAPSSVVAVSFQIGELGGFTELAVVRIAEDPGIAERRREDDLVDQGVDDAVAALVLLQLDLGFGGFEELHGAANPNHGDALAMAIGRRMDRLHPAREVAAGGRPVIRFDFHRAQRRQLAVEAA